MTTNFLLFFIEISCIHASVVSLQPSDEIIISATSSVLLDSFEGHFDTMLIADILTITLDNPIGRILTAHNQFLPAVIESFETGHEVATKQHYNVVLLDSWRSLVILRTLLTGRSLDPTGFYLVLLLSQTDMHAISAILLRMMANLYIYNVAVLYRVDDSVVLYTYFPYGSPGYRGDQITKWNTFRQGRYSKRSRRHFPSKFSNLNGAALRVALFTVMPFMNLIYDDRNKTIVDYGGIEGNLLKMVARSLNFKIVPVEPSNNLRWGVFLPSGNSTGAMGMLLDRTADLTLGFFGNNRLRQRYLSGTQSHYQTSLTLIVTPGSKYGSIEKLLLPFQLNLWMFSGLVFTIALLTIVVLKRFPPTIRYFIYGRTNRTPALNLFQATVGNPVVPAPSRNFARFLLLLWVLGAFILRSAYQQIMFYNLHHARNHSTVRTWSDFIASDYRIYATTTEAYLLANLPAHIQHQITVIPASEANATLQAIRNGHLRGARIGFPESVYFQNLQVIRNAADDGQTFCKQFNERLYSYSLSVFFRKNSPLVDAFDAQIQPLVTHGFVQRWTRLELDARKLLEVVKARSKRARTQTLTIRMLSGVWGIFGVGVLGSVVVFLGELGYRQMNV